MHSPALLIAATLLLGTCNYQTPDQKTTSPASPQISQEKLIINCNTTPLPAGYKRVALMQNSFGAWLRDYPFSKSDEVYLFNGALSPNQNMQYRVLDLSIGTQNLQQCADAILRLRSEFYFEHKMYHAIRFPAKGVEFVYTDYLKGYRYKLAGSKLVSVQESSALAEPSKTSLHDFLQIVFAYCGTYTVYEASVSIRANEVMPGDMLIKPGSPGHAMIVMDIAENIENGNLIVLLAQGFMPAQSAHVVKNEQDVSLNPWYLLQDETVLTPGFNFNADCWYKWK